jgi:3-hydroxyisobutyryl-CoA hydrolase
MYEGIRALILDKDNAPRWDPPSLEKLRAEEVHEYFRPTGYSLKDIPIFKA